MKFLSEGCGEKHLSLHTRRRARQCKELGSWWWRSRAATVLRVRMTKGCATYQEQAFTLEAGICTWCKGVLRVEVGGKKG